MRRRADAVAVVYEGKELSYGKLNERANRLAHLLIAHGIGSEHVVGICLERSFEILVAMLGVLKAGAAYLPLDPGYPKDRLAFMVNDAAPRCVLASTSCVPKLPDWAKLILLDDPQVIRELSQSATTTPQDRGRNGALSGQSPAY